MSTNDVGLNGFVKFTVHVKLHVLTSILFLSLMYAKIIVLCCVIKFKIIEVSYRESQS